MSSNVSRLHEVDVAFRCIAAGERAGVLESETLDFKEDPGRRDSEGRLIPGSPQDDRAARLLSAEAACLSNHEGGALVIGVDDKAVGAAALHGTPLDAPWLRQRIRELTLPPLTVACEERMEAGVRLLVVLAPRNDGAEPHSAMVSRSGGRRIPRRVGTTCQDMVTLAEQLQWAKERSAYDWSVAPSGRRPSDARPAAIEALRDYLRESEEPDRVALADGGDDELLRRLQLVRPDGSLTRGGALLLCPADEPRVVYLHRPAPGAPADSRVSTARRGLVEELRRVEDAIGTGNRSFSLSAPGLARGTVNAIATSTIREALVNAVMHRDWDSADPITVDHVRDELIVFSPGGLFGGVTLLTLLTAPSRTRNRALGNTLRSLRLAEREGTGVDRMYVDQVRLGHQPPVFEERDGGVRLALIGGEPTDEVLRANAALDRALRHTARAAVALDLLRKQPSITAIEFAAAAQESEPQALGFLGEAERLGMLKRTANPRPGGIRAWRLADQIRAILGPVLPYFSRPADESVLLIEQLARSQGIVRNQDVQDLLGVRANRASQLLARTVSEGRLVLADGAKPVGRGAAYAPGT